MTDAKVQMKVNVKSCKDYHDKISKKRQSIDEYDLMALYDKTQWSLGDIELIKKLSVELEADTIDLKDSSLSQKRKVVELQSLLLKGVSTTSILAPLTQEQPRPRRRRSRALLEPATILNLLALSK